MSCSEFDPRDYFFGELPEADRAAVARHMATCEACAEELVQLQALRGNLMTLRDEEMPRRIGFVSDKIFEPSPFRRWLSGFWLSGARLGFASAAMLSVALVFYSTRPQPTMIVERRAEGVAQQVDVKAVVAEAVKVAMAEQEKKTSALLQASERKHQDEKRDMVLMLSDYALNIEKRFAASKKEVALNFTSEAQPR